MNKTEIFQKVVNISIKYGPKNSQQFAQLIKILGQENDDDLFDGLFRIFEFEEYKYTAQELSGKLLLTLKPSCPDNLSERIKKILNTYELSVEELPFYLKEILGKENMINLLDEIETQDLPDSEKKAIKTLQWWIESKSKK